MVSVGLTFYLSVHITTQGNFVAGRPAELLARPNANAVPLSLKTEREERQTGNGVEGKETCLETHDKMVNR
jgi:hypothetical protein